MMPREIVSKRGYLKLLKKKLRFKYSKDDIKGILNDYNEIFDIEIAQGKTEKEVCILLGDPGIIVQNLNQEIHPKDALNKNILSKRNMLQGIVLATICLIIAYIVSGNHGGNVLLELLVAFPVIALLLWILLIKANFTYSDAKTKKSFLPIKISHAICFLTALFLFCFLNYGVVNFVNEQTGIFVVRVLYGGIALLCGLIIFNIFGFKGNKFASYSVICHAIGVITIIIYYINILHSLDTLSLYSLQIKQSAFIYLEVIIIMSIFIILSHKREAKKWMHN